jgi:nucleolar protein 9
VAIERRQAFYSCSTSDEDPAGIPEQSDYLSTLFRDPTSSHLLETVVTRAPDRAFVILWSTYFQGKLARLSAHPVANFVVARAMERVNTSQLESACEELRESWGKIISK